MSGSTGQKLGGETAQAVVDTAAPSTEVASKSPMQLAAGRLRKDKLTLVSLVVVLLFVLAAITAPWPCTSVGSIP